MLATIVKCVWRIYSIAQWYMYVYCICIDLSTHIPRNMCTVIFIVQIRLASVSTILISLWGQAILENYFRRKIGQHRMEQQYCTVQTSKQISFTSIHFNNNNQHKTSSKAKHEHTLPTEISFGEKYLWHCMVCIY